ncbi:trimethylamine methyltransferase family protein [Ruegeria pomeroyi]|uniref:Methyltransferase n=1 Tax=Ruegeria pomeroyi TaxID=89184 RepID=A0A9Q3WPX6_9RHOB|nr:trimethylamine methyltransferase family protein [Ruegeria pomeroyi]MCE8513865.1 trimethylamine methyltransferase family protein [Ruegeria pomeroyi]MCE8522924.1 trimethylamine methyltransferase family protein [Ruegeria pomeroyi]MCE8530537.1 trimethylamine methyltransferase family protein [Ruegeria pomeroyi]MCE8539815.1 trimethylamine methyltransferase family protein [Ruegeria pomeroyi]MCE8552965.1 trimethylamine methyltransferase family protein [Ruegeria pomeroyi]
MSEQTSPRTRRSRRASGKAGRSAEPGQNLHLRVPFISRRIPAYDLLSDEALERIEATADRILAEIGIELRDDAEAMRLYKQAGAQVTELRADAWNVRFEPGMLREILKTAPARFTQHARNPANTVEIGGDAMVFAPAYGSPFVMDMDNGRRYGTIQDFQNLIKLGQSSPWLHHSGGTICEPTDIAVNKRHLDMVYSHMRYSDRAFLGSITAPERAADSIEMCRILFGAEFVDQNCVIMGNFNTTSPLVLDGVTTGGIRTYAEAGQGSIHLPFLLGGAVSPLTMAGAVAQCLAESMASSALTQLVRPGAPAILAGFLSSMSLRSGSPTFGTPEPALGSLVMGQLARRLNMPLRCAGNFSTSKAPDGQAMQQAMMSMMSAVQGGANYILHSAGFVDGLLSMSYEKFVMDTDMCGALHSYLAGIEVNEDTLGFEALAQNGPGEHLFGTDHTLRHYETAYWDSGLNDDQTHETWSEQGSADYAQRANQRWKDILNTYEAPPMDDATDEALRDFIDRKKASMPDAWY